MELQFVTFEQAQALKELGFPQNESSTCYDNTGQIHYTSCMDTWLDNNLTYYCLPSLELAAKWLREEKLLYLSVQVNEHCTHWFWDIINIRNEEEITDPSIKGYWSYDEALSAGIDKAIEILKNK